GFQGLCAALLFSISINSRILFMVFGAITMMESAVQKLLVLTLIFGQTWWKALNAWTESVTQLFGVSTQSEGSTYIVGIYLGLFIIWGLILGNWMFYLPHQIREREQKYAHIIPEPSIEAPLKTGKKTTITAFILFIFLASGLWLSTEKGALSAFMLLVRTVVVVILWIYLILPVWQKFIQRWLIQQKEKHQEISLVLNIIPHLSRYVKPLYQSIAANHKGVGKWKEFILSLIVLSLNGEKE
ncbi:MAG: hypothetical protein K1X92_04560, partial [Bacteroidia bacterium]|nr:hypothetical protein [Bacteroidia bacterium]